MELLCEEDAHKDTQDLGTMVGERGRGIGQGEEGEGRDRGGGKRDRGGGYYVHTLYIVHN